MPKTSRDVMIEVGIPYRRFIDLMRRNAFTPPVKNSSGQYVWMPPDIERLREALTPRFARNQQPAA